jgi:hypothetical protein
MRQEQPIVVLDRVPERNMAKVMEECPESRENLHFKLAGLYVARWQ